MSASKTSPLYLTRFIAAYLVLMVHYSPDSWRAYCPMIRHFGEPVNYFFFISGFVMIVSAKRHFDFSAKAISFDKLDFWIKRIARIYPMYILALLVFVLYNYTVKEIDASIPKRIWPELTGLNRWIYNGSINFPSWTVSSEFFFYFLFPFSLPLLVKSSFKRLTIIVLILYTVSILFTFYYHAYLDTLLSLSTSAIVRTLAGSILLHPIFKYTIFLFGCLCGRFYITSPRMAFFEKYNIPIFVLSTLIVILFYKYDIVQDIFFDAGILAVVYFFLVLSLCSFSGNLLKIASWKPFVFLGEISYGVYIMQAPVEHYFESLFTNSKPFTTGTQFISYTLFLIAICWVLYYTFEIPAKLFILNSFQKTRTKD